MGWINRYSSRQLYVNFGALWKTKKAAVACNGNPGYLDTVRVFAEVPVTPRKASAGNRHKVSKSQAEVDIERGGHGKDEWI